MILEYSYDKGNKVLDLFKKSELATLNIRKVKDGDEDKFVMEYTLISDYAETRQTAIKELLSESLAERLQLANVLNQFIENQILNNVIDFSLKFNAVKVKKCEITYSSSYKQAVQNISLLQELTNCLERYEHIVTKMGIADQATSNIYRREGTGRNKKYVPLTIKEVSDTLRQSLAED